MARNIFRPISFFTGLVLLHPLVVLVFSLHWGDFQNFIQLPELFPALKFTIYQAFLSALISVTLGLVFAPGFAVLGRSRPLFRFLFILPNALSPIFIVLSLLMSFSEFPFGLIGILTAHVYVNFGLATVIIGERWDELVSKWKPVAATLGAKTPLIATKIILPQLIPDILNVFAVVFSFCLGSFAIPLTLGGSPEFSTLEVLAFERLQVQADMTGAVVLAITQSLLQFVVFALILRTTSFRRQTRDNVVSKSPSVFGAVVSTLGAGLVLVPIVKLLISLEGHEWTVFSNELYKSALSNSLLLGIFSGLGILVWLLILTFTGWSNWLVNIPSVSGVVLGLSTLVVLRFDVFLNKWVVIPMLIVGHFILNFPSVFRTALQSMTELRAKNSRVLSVYGAGARMSILKVYLPLGRKTFWGASLLGFTWSMGEFSLARVLNPDGGTVPLYVQSLLGSYRLEEAAQGAIVLLAFGILASLLIEVLSHR